ncbi:MAG TPA: FecR domain-containing protein [Cyclobacteriaceae bacterium]|nr:FecR domain-containing protein [Cyclobacteriaceae bacterium]
MSRFKTLLQLYIENKASEREVAELMNLIHDDANKATFNQVLDEILLTDHKGQGQTEEERSASLKQILSGEKRSGVSRMKIVWMAAAAISLLVLVGLGLYKNELPAISKQDDNVMTISGRDFVLMPDGSTITLKEGSELTYAKSFGVTNREVTLEGEAFFDVAHNASIPFKVHTGKIITTVLGTAFNISSQQEKIVVTVTRGKVSVGDESKRYDVITPNEQIAVNTLTGVYKKAVVDSVEVMQWKKDYFILESATIEQAAMQIEKRFNVKVIITNENLKKCTISAWFLNNESLEQVIKGVSAVQQATFTIKDDLITIEGGIGCGE